MILIIAMLILVSTVYGAIPPSAEFNVFFDSNLIDKPNAIFLGCTSEIYETELRADDTLLDIKEFDAEKNCTWRATQYGESVECYGGVCYSDVRYQFSRDVRLAVLHEDKTYITNPIEVEVGLGESFNFYRALLLSNGSARIFRIDGDELVEIIVDPVDPAIDKGDGVVEGEPNDLPYLPILGILIALVAWLVYRKILKKN